VGVLVVGRTHAALQGVAMLQLMLLQRLPMPHLQCQPCYVVVLVQLGRPPVRQQRARARVVRCGAGCLLRHIHHSLKG
jgi:hypothetical protein